MYDDRYGLLFQSYFTGPTGRQIQAHGADACILGMYLASCRHANMIGLYELPLPFIAHDLPVIGGGDHDRIREALEALGDVGFAYYDPASEFVWVVEMARIRCGLAPGAVLNTRDRRHLAIVRLYSAIKVNAFLGAFYDRYAEQLTLPGKRGHRGPSSDVLPAVEATVLPAVEANERGAVEGPSKFPASPSKGARKPLASPLEGAQEHLSSPSKGAMKGLVSPIEASKQDQDQDQESGSVNRIRNQDQRSTPAQNTRRAAADPEPRTADENVSVIAALVLREVLPALSGSTTLTDIIETTKAKCAAHHIAYNSSVVARAVESAIGRPAGERRS